MNDTLTMQFAILYPGDYGWKVYDEYDSLDEALEHVIECVATMSTEDVRVVANVFFDIKLKGK